MATVTTKHYQDPHPRTEITVNDIRNDQLIKVIINSDIIPVQQCKINDSLINPVTLEQFAQQILSALGWKNK